MKFITLASCEPTSIRPHFSEPSTTLQITSITHFISGHWLSDPRANTQDFWNYTKLEISVILFHLEIEVALKRKKKYRKKSWDTNWSYTHTTWVWAYSHHQLPLLPSPGLFIEKGWLFRIVSSEMLILPKF